MFRFRLRFRFKGLEAIPSINDLASCKVFFFEIKRADSRGFIWAKVFTAHKSFLPLLQTNRFVQRETKFQMLRVRFVLITSSAVDCTACSPYFFHEITKKLPLGVLLRGKKIKFWRRNWHRLIHIHTLCLVVLRSNALCTALVNSRIGSVDYLQGTIDPSKKKRSCPPAIEVPGLAE